MTLLQTRVEDGVAAKFRKVASQRGLKPYTYLQQLITDAANPPEPNNWRGHWARVEELHLTAGNKSFSEIRAAAEER